MSFARWALIRMYTWCMNGDLVILYRLVSITEITEWLVKCYDKQVSGRERGWGRGESLPEMAYGAVDIHMFVLYKPDTSPCNCYLQVYKHS